MQEELPILLFEDSDNDAQSILRAFRKAQVRNPIIHFSTGMDGLKYLFREFRQNRPVGAFLILDLTLPDLSGFEILRWLRNNPVGRKMPVILLTDAQQEGEVAEVAGAAFLGHRLCIENQKEVNMCLFSKKE